MHRLVLKRRVGDERRVDVILPPLIGQLDALRRLANSQLLQALVVFALEGVCAAIGEADVESFYELEVFAPCGPMNHQWQ